MNIMHVEKMLLFTDITILSDINYIHKEKDFIDFNSERLLPHKLSQYGPGLAAADIDGNGLMIFTSVASAIILGKFFFNNPMEIYQ